MKDAMSALNHSDDEEHVDVEAGGRQRVDGAKNGATWGIILLKYIPSPV